MECVSDVVGVEENRSAEVYLCCLSQQKVSGKPNVLSRTILCEIRRRCLNLNALSQIKTLAPHLCCGPSERKIQTDFNTLLSVSFAICCVLMLPLISLSVKQKCFKFSLNCFHYCNLNMQPFTVRKTPVKLQYIKISNKSH